MEKGVRVYLGAPSPSLPPSECMYEIQCTDTETFRSYKYNVLTQKYLECATNGNMAKQEKIQRGVDLQIKREATGSFPGGGGGTVVNF